MEHLRLSSESKLPPHTTASLSASQLSQRSGRGGRGRAIRPWISVIVLLAAWQVADALNVLNPNVLPGPTAIFQAAWELTATGALGSALLASLPRVVIGLSLGILIGVGFGLVAAFSRVGADLIDRPMQMIRAIPFTAWVSLFILWFGIGELPKLMLVFVGTAIPLYINTYTGVRNVDTNLIELGRVYRHGLVSIAANILLPGALPTILAGLRQSAAIAWIALIVAETVATNQGIGFLLTNARQFSQTDIVIVCILLYAALGLLTDWLVRLIEGRMLAWRQTSTGRQVQRPDAHRRGRT